MSQVQFAPVSGIGCPGCVIAEQRHLARMRQKHLGPLQHVPELFPVCQRDMAELVPVAYYAV